MVLLGPQSLLVPSSLFTISICLYKVSYLQTVSMLSRPRSECKTGKQILGKGSENNVILTKSAAVLVKYFSPLIFSLEVVTCSILSLSPSPSPLSYLYVMINSSPSRISQSSLCASVGYVATRKVQSHFRLDLARLPQIYHPPSARALFALRQPHPMQTIED